MTVQGTAIMTACRVDPGWCEAHIGTAYDGNLPEFRFDASDPMTDFLDNGVALWLNQAYGSMVYLGGSQFVDKGDNCPDCAFWSLNFAGNWSPGIDLAGAPASGILIQSVLGGAGTATYSFNGTITIGGTSLVANPDQGSSDSVGDSPAPASTSTLDNTASSTVSVLDTPADPPVPNPEPATLVYLPAGVALLLVTRGLRRKSV